MASTTRNESVPQQTALADREDTLPSADELERMYELMALITCADQRIGAQVRKGLMAGPCYSVRGMEAVCAALGMVLAPGDQLISTYRNLGDALAKGVPLPRVVAELKGRRDGVAGGRGGPMHIHDHAAGLVATTGIVGSGLPIATGLALAAKLDGAERVVAVTFGDGATAIGAYHEAMNMAALWKLPVVFVCQNNMWAEHTALADHAPSTQLARRAAAYAMTSAEVDGFDAVATWQTLRAAVTAARAGEGPVFVECRTYRLGGHTNTALHAYMPQDEFDAALARDPAPTLRRWLQEHDHVAGERLDEIDGAVSAAVEDALAFAESSPQPDGDALYADVFADSGWVAGR